MDDLDRVVIRAWKLSAEAYTDEIYAAFEELVPLLEAAGYAKTEGNAWHWTSAGAARAELLTGETPT